MAFSKDNKYWKITNISINRQMTSARVRVSGFKNKDSADKKDLMIDFRNVELSLSDYPFVNGLDIDQIQNTYIKVKNKETYFSDAENV